MNDTTFPPDAPVTVGLYILRPQTDGTILTESFPVALVPRKTADDDTLCSRLTAVLLQEMVAIESKARWAAALPKTRGGRRAKRFLVLSCDPATPADSLVMPGQIFYTIEQFARIIGMQATSIRTMLCVARKAGNTTVKCRGAEVGYLEECFDPSGNSDLGLRVTLRPGQHCHRDAVEEELPVRSLDITGKVIPNTPLTEPPLAQSCEEPTPEPVQPCKHLNNPEGLM